MDRPDAAAEADLVRAVADGSQSALAELYDRHADAIHATAWRLTSDRQVAEEVVQETFLALWNRAELFDPEAGSLSTWLRAIARNRTVDRLRAAGRRPGLVALSAAAGDDEDGGTLDRLVGARPLVGGGDAGAGPEAALDAADLRATIASALAAMPEPERTVILLAYREELSQSEIAARLGWPIGTVKTRTRRALHRLRSVLGPELAPDGSPDEEPIPAGQGSGE